MHNFNWVFLTCLKPLKVNAGGDHGDFFFFFFLSQFELRDWRERFQKCYIDTGVFSPTSIFNLLIKQEGVLSQQAVEIKAKEKWLYLT